jgi:alkylation response protein AidB-like acyl-CoA dehydrogenase
MGHDVTAMITIIEMLSQRSLGLSGLYIMIACYGALNIVASGSEAQKQRFLPALAAGKLRVAYGLSEPDVGADLASVKTRAERQGDQVIINGTKRWCSGGDIADYIFMLVRTGDPAARGRNLTILLVPPNTPGVTVTPITVMGCHGITTTDVYLDNATISFDLVLGGEAGWNNGWQMLSGNALEAERLEVPAQALGLAQAAVDEAWRYSQERRQFGKPICAYQSIRHTLADCRTRLQACRLMVYWAAARVEAGEALPADTAMTKLFVTETAKDIVLACQQVMGAYGYADGFGMERYARDVLALPIYGGSSAIQRNNIAKMLGLPKD